MSRDPFLIEGPAVISFSGGRTSGYMLWRILQAHHWILPDDVKVIFNNTGKERQESLDFVRDCALHWNVPVVWLEYRKGKKFAIVDYQTASRNGEPFEAIIEDRGMLPNPVASFCSSELKTRTMHRYVRSLGWTEWDTAVGLRADEERRLAKFRARGPHPESPDETVFHPLAEAGKTRFDIADFWDVQPFDLALKGVNGVTNWGNCDLCFKKSTKVPSLIRAKPDTAIWWIKQEQRFIGDPRITGNGKLFRDDRPSYASMYRMATQHGELFAFDDEPLQDCMCTD